MIIDVGKLSRRNADDIEKCDCWGCKWYRWIARYHYGGHIPLDQLELAAKDFGRQYDEAVLKIPRLTRHQKNRESDRDYLVRNESTVLSWCLSTGPGKRGIAHQLASLAESIQPKRVVDVCCGLGDMLTFLSDEKLGEEFYGMDGVLLCVTAATGICKELNVNAEFKHSYLDRLPYKDGFGDLVICLDSLHWSSKPKAVLAELARITVPGGTLYLVYQLQDMRRNSTLKPHEVVASLAAKGFVKEWDDTTEDRYYLIVKKQ